MVNIIPVDFAAFKPQDFHSQWVGTDAEGINTCFLIVTRVPPGKGTPAVHTHQGDQFYFIFKGEMNLQLADQHLKAKAGDLVYIPCAVPHKNWNSTNEEEIHFEFIVPGVFPGLARSYRTQWPEYELKPAENPHYIRSLDPSKFHPTERSAVTMADYSTGSHHCRIDIVQTPAGKGSMDLHVHTYDQVYYTMTGEMQLQIGRDTKAIAANTYVYLPAGTPHRYRNEGSGVATHIEVRVPEGVSAATSAPVKLEVAV